MIQPILPSKKQKESTMPGRRRWTAAMLFMKMELWRGAMSRNFKIQTSKSRECSSLKPQWNVVGGIGAGNPDAN
jgi:hypothetical protein